MGSRRERIGGTSLAIQEIRTIPTFPPKGTSSERSRERRDIRVRGTRRVCGNRRGRGYQRVRARFPSTESWSSRYQGNTFRSMYGWLQNDWVDMRGFTRQSARGSKWALFILGYASYIGNLNLFRIEETTDSRCSLCSRRIPCNFSHVPFVSFEWAKLGCFITGIIRLHWLRLLNEKFQSIVSVYLFLIFLCS